MTRLVLVLIVLCASTAAGTVQAQEQRDVVIQVRVGTDAARQLAGWEDGQYGSLLSGRLPGAFFTDGQAREPSLVRQSQGDPTSLSIGFADGTLHSTGDGVYDHYTLRIKDAFGTVLWQAALSDSVTTVTARNVQIGGLSGVDLLEYEGQRVIVQMDYPELKRSLVAFPGGIMGLQAGLIGFSLITGSVMMRGRYRGILTVGAAVGAGMIFPAMGIGGTGAWFVGGITLVLALAFAFLWQRISR